MIAEFLLRRGRLQIVLSFLTQVRLIYGGDAILNAGKPFGNLSQTYQNQCPFIACIYGCYLNSPYPSCHGIIYRLPKRLPVLRSPVYTPGGQTVCSREFFLVQCFVWRFRHATVGIPPRKGRSRGRGGGEARDEGRGVRILQWLTSG